MAPTTHPKIDLAYVAPQKPDEGTRKVVYSIDEQGHRQDLAVVESNFKLEKVQRMMFKTTPQLIPVDGQNVAPIEGGMEQQERESCAKSR